MQPVDDSSILQSTFRTGAAIALPAEIFGGFQSGKTVTAVWVVRGRTFVIVSEDSQKHLQIPFQI
jgi:hypothetical protein